MPWFKHPHEDGDGTITINGSLYQMRGGVFELPLDHPRPHFAREVGRPADAPDAPSAPLDASEKIGPPEVQSRPEDAAAPALVPAAREAARGGPRRPSGAKRARKSAPRRKAG
jgi:hypothetical protein